MGWEMEKVVKSKSNNLYMIVSKKLFKKILKKGI
jgi:hypothetical protein